MITSDNDPTSFTPPSGEPILFVEPSENVFPAFKQNMSFLSIFFFNFSMLSSGAGSAAHKDGNGAVVWKKHGIGR